MAAWSVLNANARRPRTRAAGRSRRDESMAKGEEERGLDFSCTDAAVFQVKFDGAQSRHFQNQD